MGLKMCSGSPGKRSAEPLGTLHDEDARPRAFIEAAPYGDACADEVGDGGARVACRGRARDRIESTGLVFDECERPTALAAVESADAVLLSARTVAEVAFEIDHLALESDLACRADWEGPRGSLRRLSRKRAVHRGECEAEYRKLGHPVGRFAGTHCDTTAGERLDLRSFHEFGVYYEPFGVAMPIVELGGGLAREAQPRARSSRTRACVSPAELCRRTR